MSLIFLHLQQRILLIKLLLYLIALEPVQECDADNS
jgi:hypothetical protein